MVFSAAFVLSVRFAAVFSPLFFLFFLDHFFIDVFLLERLDLVEQSFLVPLSSLIFAASLLVFTFFLLSSKLFQSFSLLKFEIKCSAKLLFLGNVESAFEFGHLVLFHESGLVGVLQISLNLGDQAFSESRSFF